MSVEHPANYETIIVCHFSPDDKAVFVIHSNDDWQRCGPRETAYLLGEDQSECYPMPATIHAAEFYVSDTGFHGIDIFSVSEYIEDETIVKHWE